MSCDQTPLADYTLSTGDTVTIEGFIGPNRIPVMDPLTGGPLHVPAGVHVTLIYSHFLKAYIPHPPELLDDPEPTYYLRVPCGTQHEDLNGARVYFPSLHYARLAAQVALGSGLDAVTIWNSRGEKVEELP